MSSPPTSATPPSSVFVYLACASEAEALVAEIRETGLTARRFATVASLRAGVAEDQPMAMLIELSADTDTSQLPERSLEPNAPLLLYTAGADNLDSRRLAASRACDAFLPPPLNRLALARLLDATEAFGRRTPPGSNAPASSERTAAIRPARHETALGGDDVGSAAATLPEDRLHLVYQPISSLNGHPGSLFEVFVRLTDHRGREVMPVDFLPALRRDGLGVALDRWIVSCAIQVLREQSGDHGAPVFFVKLFPESLRDTDFPHWLRKRADQVGVAAEQLVLEIPHAELMDGDDNAIGFMQAASELGFRIAVEHYDAQHDPQLLSRGGFHFVKLALGMTERIATNPDALARVQAVTAQARGAGIPAIACLVQDAFNLSALWQAGVEYIQGYFMQEPSDVFDDSNA